MSDLSKLPVESKDTGALNPDQLSNQELITIFEIESRLEAAQGAVVDEKPKGAGLYLKTVQDRHRRVLLLDGGRGSGKTSLLLTLVKRWHSRILDSDATVADLETAYRNRAEKLIAENKAPADSLLFKPIPANIVVLDILDFDPLPPGMPLIAGIMQAWRPLAEEYDKRLGAHEEEYDDDGLLMDLWHSLFQMAAAGWGTVSHSKSLIEQVLERQDQVQNWQHLDEDWSAFIREILKRGTKLKDRERLSGETVFVIMIDDCDLQVSRIRQLVPALRMLYHPKVFFLVAADRHHMVDMLKLDFYGQQSELAKHKNASPGSLWQIVQGDRWASELADSSVSKVFALSNQWQLRALALHELLDFPHNNKEKNLKVILDGWIQQDLKERDLGKLGTYLKSMAGSPTDPIDLAPIMPYRAANQIVEKASAFKQNKQSALEAIRHILGRFRPDELVRISEQRKGGKTTKENPDPPIEYLAAGELIAIFHKGFREQIENEGEIVLSARPFFRYTNESSRNMSLIDRDAETDAEYISALLASSLRADGYGVVAPSLVWDARLALAWTEVRVFERNLSLNLAFRWQLHEHPSPLRLLHWTKDWRDYIHGHSNTAHPRLERIAYAWIYYQLKWLRKNLESDLPSGLRKLPNPLTDKFNDEQSWSRLLGMVPETGSEIAYWNTRTLPLLARPELGLPRTVQERLLENMGGDADIEWLRDQRRRRITDAIIAAADQVGTIADGAEDQEQAVEVANIFEERHYKVYKEPSPWSEYVEDAETQIQNVK